MSFLGHAVSSEGIKTDPDKVETVRTWPTPVDIKELQGFIGLAITIGGLFLYSPSSQNHSTNCRGKVYLSLFERDKDATQPLGFGAVLSRLQLNDTERVIAYVSRSLNEQEKNYCGTRLEMLALVNCMDHFRYYLVKQKLRLRTDNHSFV